MGDDHIDSKTNHLREQGRKSFIVFVRPSEFDGYIAALLIT
jgi:hypothetical protein